MDPSEKLKEIARQLRQPHGDKGVEMAEMMQESNASMTAHAIAALTISDKDHLLEIGHGSAAHVEALFKNQPNIHYQGLELSTLMHELAQHNNQALIDQGRADFTRYKAHEKLPYASHTFDKIFTVNTHYFWEEPQPMFDDIYRVLRAGGSFALTFALKQFMEGLPFTAYEFKLYEIAELEEMALASGFTRSNWLQDKDHILSKAGQWVDRPYATLVFSK